VAVQLASLAETPSDMRALLASFKANGLEVTSINTLAIDITQMPPTPPAPSEGLS
jgi:hypothetical protein